jgi:prolyl oligopeptidase
MPSLIEPPPSTRSEPVAESLHGVSISDPYRWLEDSSSLETRAWLDAQTRYARAYFDRLSGRERIRQSIHEFLAVETYDSIQKAGNRYVFRKRLPEQEQACIYMREGQQGEDQLLFDPTKLSAGNFASVKPLRISPDGRLLLLGVKEAGERMANFLLLDMETREMLPDALPRGYLRGFAFAPDSRSFYYTHERADVERTAHRAAYHHVLGTRFSQDTEIFAAREDKRTRLFLCSDGKLFCFVVHRFPAMRRIDLYVKSADQDTPAERILHDLDCDFRVQLMDGRVLALTDLDAPRRRIIELRLRTGQPPDWIDIIPETHDRIASWLLAGSCIFVSYFKGMSSHILFFDLCGRKRRKALVRTGETLRMISASGDGELFLEAESFTRPLTLFRCSGYHPGIAVWSTSNIPFDSREYQSMRLCFPSKDGTSIPLFLVGRSELLENGPRPVVMTAYGGFGRSVTPQFSVFVAFLIEHGCLFALPGIRGGSEFGANWHSAAKRLNRQTAYDDFLSAAEWLITTGRTTAEQLAIFGGSNSGLLVGVALTRRPELFRAVVCMVPLLDMLRYHLFDGAHVWSEEYGTATNPDEFSVLAQYSPYQHVRPGKSYPAVMIISGDADLVCNPMHARKMVARLQSANTSSHPILLDYSAFRGHSATLPFTKRVDALTDRLAFLCDQLQLPV